MADLPENFIRYLDSAGIKYTLHRGRVFYHTVDDYKRGKDILQRIGRQSQQKYNSYLVRMVVTLTADSGLEFPELVTFDSEEEAEYYFYLRDKQLAGEVKTIRLHPRLELFPKFESGGEHHQAIFLTPDFYVEYQDGRREYVDVKGMSNEAGDLRRKLYDYLASTATDRSYYGVPLRWVSTSFKHGDADGWIGYDQLQQIRAKNRKAKKGA